MKEKLELQHIAPYIPFKIKAMDLVSGNSFELDLENISSVMNDAEYLNTIRLILRPLSDLTKEIEHNGERFKPFHNREFPIELKTEVKSSFVGNYIEETLSFIVQSSKPNIIFGKSINILNKLFEWHFDVFCLIERGLAIDINTLDK